MMNIKKIIREEIDDWGWVEDIPVGIPFDRLRRGDYITVYELTDYYYDSMSRCNNSSNLVNVGETYRIDGENFNVRSNQDCGVCGEYGMDCSEKMKSIKFNQYWFNQDMVKVIKHES